MYNEEQKRKFIKTYSDKIVARDEALRIFDILEKYEAAWGADLCTQPPERLQQALDSVAGVRKASSRAAAGILKRYGRWCLENNIPGACDALLNLKSSTGSRLETSMVTTPATLQRFLNAICDPESKQTADDCIRVYTWLAYAGMQYEDIFLVRTGDVDFSRAQIHFGGVDYPLYPASFDAFRNCVELDSFVYEHPNYNGSIRRSRLPGDILIRSIRGSFTIHGLQARFSRMNKNAIKSGKTELSLSYKRIWLSGTFYRAWEREQAGEPKPFGFDALAEQMVVEEKSNALSVNIHVMRQRYVRNMLDDYGRWKNLFK